MPRPAAFILAFILFLAAIGCGSSEPPVVNTPMSPMGGGPPTGNKVCDTHCLNCHAAQPGGAPRKGPNLAKVGSTRTPEWLTDHVKNPKTHKPESGMPEFGSKLSAEELKSVTDFM